LFRSKISLELGVDPWRGSRLCIVVGVLPYIETYPLQSIFPNPVWAIAQPFDSQHKIFWVTKTYPGKRIVTSQLVFIIQLQPPRPMHFPSCASQSARIIYLYNLCIALSIIFYLRRRRSGLLGRGKQGAL